MWSSTGRTTFPVSDQKHPGKLNQNTDSLGSVLDFLGFYGLSFLTWINRLWEVDYKESWEPKNRCCWTVVLEKTLESPLDCKEIRSVHHKGNLSWLFIGRTDAEAEAPVLWPHVAKMTHWKRLWCWERLKAGGERDNRGWDGWIASLTQWTWVWVGSRRWWWTGRPGMLQS